VFLTLLGCGAKMVANMSFAAGVVRRHHRLAGTHHHLEQVQGPARVPDAARMRGEDGGQHELCRTPGLQICFVNLQNITTYVFWQFGIDRCICVQ
jgi:hypothetical protein